MSTNKTGTRKRMKKNSQKSLIIHGTIEAPKVPKVCNDYTLLLGEKTRSSTKFLGCCMISDIIKFCKKKKEEKFKVADRPAYQMANRGWSIHHLL